MTKQEMEKYKDSKPIAVHSISNFGGVEIMDIEYGIEDYAIWRYNFGEPEKRLHRSKIGNGNGYQFIQVDDFRIRLDKFIRTT